MFYLLQAAFRARHAVTSDSAVAPDTSSSRVDTFPKPTFCFIFIILFISFFLSSQLQNRTVSITLTRPSLYPYLWSLAGLRERSWSKRKDCLMPLLWVGFVVVVRGLAG